jgi:hypothetical protein
MAQAAHSPSISAADVEAGKRRLLLASLWNGFEDDGRALDQPQSYAPRPRGRREAPRPRGWAGSADMAACAADAYWTLRAIFEAGYAQPLNRVRADLVRLAGELDRIATLTDAFFDRVRLRDARDYLERAVRFCDEMSVREVFMAINCAGLILTPAQAD